MQINALLQQLTLPVKECYTNMTPKDRRQFSFRFCPNSLPRRANQIKFSLTGKNIGLLQYISILLFCFKLYVVLWVFFFKILSNAYKNIFVLHMQVLYGICIMYANKKNITNITWTYFASDPDFTKSPKYVFHHYNRWYFVCYVHYDACKSHTCLINNSHLFKLMYVRYIFYYIRVIS